MLPEENDTQHCHIFMKGCSKEDYDDFIRTTNYIENAQEPGAVTSVFSVCDSDECCNTYSLISPKAAKSLDKRRKIAIM